MKDAEVNPSNRPLGGSPHWKGYVLPGPTIPLQKEPQVLGPSKDYADQSLDALSGHFRIFQYREGHRFSTDDLLVAWYGTSHAPSVARALDLGSGLGAVGMIAAWRLRLARFVTIEAQSASVKLARKSALVNGLEDRYEIREGDFRDPGILKVDETFDLILASPPYFPCDSGPKSDNPQKIACRFEIRGDIRDYCRIAAGHLAPGGGMALVFPVSPPHQEKRVLDAVREAHMLILRRRDVILKEGDAPLLGLFYLVNSADVPEQRLSTPWVEPALVIRNRDGSCHPEYMRVKMSLGFGP